VPVQRLWAGPLSHRFLNKNSNHIYFFRQKLTQTSSLHHSPKCNRSAYAHTQANALINDGVEKGASMFCKHSLRRSVAQPLVLLSVVALFVLVLAACAPIAPAKSGASAQPTKAAEPTKAASTAMTNTASSAIPTTTTTTTTEGTTVMVADHASLGKILVDAKGMTLYLFDKDAKDKSNCSGDCLKNWPALTVKGEKEAMAGKEVVGKLGTIKRDDGTYQVTVNGMPVYYYAKDKTAGDVVGQGVGDVWWVLGPDGNKITKK
jgi:predicted lipoprotein with Yx(FWY)xxD motif